MACGAQHSLARADLEALVEARHAATLGLGQQPTQINTNRTSSFASQIAAAAGISPSAASIALQLAARAGEYSAMEEERERARANSRRDREQEFYSHHRPRTTSGMDYTPSASSSIANSLGSNLWQELRPRLGAASSIMSSTLGLPIPRDNKVASNLSMPNEIQNRLAIAEQLAQLSSRVGGVSKATSGYGEDLQSTAAGVPFQRKREESEVLQNQSALFQDLGLMGVRLEEIQYALARNISLEELLRKAQNGLNSSNGLQLERKTVMLDRTRGAMYDDCQTNNEVDDELNKEHGTRSVWSIEAELKASRERPALQGVSRDSSFPRDMVESALNSMGVEMTAA